MTHHASGEITWHVCARQFGFLPPPHPLPESRTFVYFYVFCIYPRAFLTSTLLDYHPMVPISITYRFIASGIKTFVRSDLCLVNFSALVIVVLLVASI